MFDLKYVILLKLGFRDLVWGVSNATVIYGRELCGTSS
jgi:hypothetical protein